MEETIREGVKLHGYRWKATKYIANRLNEKYGHEWHCIIGKAFGSYVGDTLSYYSAKFEGFRFRVFRTLISTFDSCPAVEVVRLTTSDSRKEVNIKVSLMCFVIQVFSSLKR